MTSLRRTFRLWWQPPRRAADREADRQVTFLELNLSPVPLLLVLNLLLLAPVFYGFKTWLGIVAAQANSPA